ncbi:MAG TPA: PIG-L family deacetylase [Ktedonobacteraceae bacterium]|nr:PIG-L family deacetylase [Ktedonobacteraceae bacterium]
MIPELFKKHAYARKAIAEEDYDYIYISPHFDDVAFSCSGTICSHKAQGMQVLVVTLFAGDPQPPFSPLARACHQLWQVPEGIPPYQIRKAEDEKAMSELGVDYVWLDWREAIYRLPDLSDLSEINDDRADLRHDPIFPTLSQWLVDLHASYPSTTIVVPLGVGRHRDHRIICQAALNVLDRSTLLFFEDFPYVAYLPEETMELVRSYQLVPLEVDISRYLEQRIHAAGCYQSQHAMLFFPPSSFQDTIREYAYRDKLHRFVERYWKFSRDF